MEPCPNPGGGKDLADNITPQIDHTATVSTAGVPILDPLKEACQLTVCDWWMI